MQEADTRVSSILGSGYIIIMEHASSLARSF